MSVGTAAIGSAIVVIWDHRETTGHGLVDLKRLAGKVRRMGERLGQANEAVVKTRSAMMKFMRMVGKAASLRKFGIGKLKPGDLEYKEVKPIRADKIIVECGICFRKHPLIAQAVVDMSDPERRICTGCFYPLEEDYVIPGMEASDG